MLKSLPLVPVNVVLWRKEDHCGYNQKRKRSYGVTVALTPVAGTLMKSFADTDTWNEDSSNKNGDRKWSEVAENQN